MAPEQAAGESTDERADVYALGAVLYELITGRLPHVAETTMALIDRKLRGVAESPRERAPGRGIPATLDRAVMRSLKRFPEQRYQTQADSRVRARVRARQTRTHPDPAATSCGKSDARCNVSAHRRRLEERQEA